MIYSIFSYIIWIVYFLGFIFWIWMVIECLKNDPERFLWIWILLFFNFIGAVIYFFVRQPLKNRISTPRFFRKWSLKNDLLEAEENARVIGNAHQYIILGELLIEMSLYERAEKAFVEALKKDPDEVRARWGKSVIDMRNKKFQLAEENLEALLEKDPNYKYGEASLSLCRSLFLQGEKTKAKKILTEHLKKWNHPEARYLLANIYIEDNSEEEALKQLNTIKNDVRTAPPFYRRKQNKWYWKANKVLKDLGK